MLPPLVTAPVSQGQPHSEGGPLTGNMNLGNWPRADAGTQITHLRRETEVQGACGCLVCSPNLLLSLATDVSSQVFLRLPILSPHVHVTLSDPPCPDRYLLGISQGMLSRLPDQAIGSRPRGV